MTVDDTAVSSKRRHRHRFSADQGGDAGDGEGEDNDLRYIVCDDDTHFFPIDDETIDALCWSKADRDFGVVLSNDKQTATADKGYKAVRGNRWVTKGTHYYEFTVDTEKEGGFVRAGWLSDIADLDCPVGFSKQGFAFNSKTGHKYSDLRPTPYGSPYGKGDVVGCMIHLPDTTRAEQLEPKLLLDKSLDVTVKVKRQNKWWLGHVGIPDKDHQTLEGSWIEFFLNGESQGVAFTDIPEGRYYPAASFFMGGKVTANWGPNWKCSPKTNTLFEPFSGVLQQKPVWLSPITGEGWSDPVPPQETPISSKDDSKKTKLKKEKDEGTDRDRKNNVGLNKTFDALLRKKSGQPGDPLPAKEVKPSKPKKQGGLVDFQSMMLQRSNSDVADQMEKRIREAQSHPQDGEAEDDNQEGPANKRPKLEEE